jgi:hypothetical protein
MRALFAVLLLLAGCALPPQVLKRAVDLEPRDGTRVVLAGVYERVPVAPEKGAAPAHLGHVVVRVEGVPVRLGLAPRPLEELTQLGGRLVAVQGLLVLRPPPEQLPKPWESLPRAVIHDVPPVVPYGR